MLIAFTARMLFGELLREWISVIQATVWAAFAKAPPALWLRLL